MNLAHWTPSPTLEREAAEEQRGRRKLAWRIRTFALLAATILPVAFFSPALGVLTLLLIPVYIVAFFGLGFGILAQYERIRSASAQWAETNRDELALRSAWPVELMIRHESTPTGLDRGMLWIEDDRLYFSGRRTSFGITADQVAGFCRIETPIPDFRYDLELKLSQPGIKDFSISFRPVATTFSGYGPATEICASVNRWVGRGTARDGQLPPLEIGPGAPSSGRLLTGATVAIGYWTLFIAAILLSLYSRAPLLSIAVAFAGLLAGVFWNAVWSPHLRYQAWQARQSLEWEAKWTAK